MKDSSIKSSKRLRTELQKIEKLLQEKKCKEALAEIRDFETSQKIDKIPSEELFQFYYLKAFILRSLGSYQDALESGRKAFSIIKDTANNKKIAQTQYVLGLIHISLGNLKDAEVEIRDALTGFRRAADYNGIVDALSRLGQIDFIKSNYAKAVDYTLEALEYTKKTEDKRKTAILLGNLGVRYTLMSRWEEAEEKLRLSVKLNEENRDEINLARGLLSLGYVSSQQRDFRKADKYYKKAVKIIFENNYNREFAIYNEYSGELEFVKGNYEKAKNHYLDAIEIGEKIAPEGDIINQSYRLLAELQVAQKQYDRALESCQRSLKVSLKLHDKLEQGVIYRVSAQAYLGKGDEKRAREHFENSITCLKIIKNKYELAKTYLEVGKSRCFEYFVRLKFLGKAEDLFKELDTEYHQGLVNLASACLLFEHNEPERSLLFLNSAEKIFQELKEEKELKSVSDLKKKLSFVPFASSFPQKVRFSDIITQDSEMLSVIEKARRIKDSPFTILLEGETGTGKDLLARAMHFESRYKDKPFCSGQLCGNSQGVGGE